MHIWYFYTIYVSLATYKILVSCCFLVVLNVFSHHKVLYNSIIHAFPILAFVIVKCSTTIKSKVPLMYVALQILVELTQTYRDVNVGAKVIKFLVCAQPFICNHTHKKPWMDTSRSMGKKGCCWKPNFEPCRFCFRYHPYKFNLIGIWRFQQSCDQCYQPFV